MRDLSSWRVGPPYALYFFAARESPRPPVKTSVALNCCASSSPRSTRLANVALSVLLGEAPCAGHDDVAVIRPVEFRFVMLEAVHHG